MARCPLLRGVGVSSGGIDHAQTCASAAGCVPVVRARGRIRGERGRERVPGAVPGDHRRRPTPASCTTPGVDVEHTGFKPGEGSQTVNLSLFPSQAESLEDDGVELEQVDDRRARWSKALRQLLDGGDSPNPFYTVYRSYSEPGGIADEMRAIAAAHRDIVKLETIGHTTLGKPILVDEDHQRRAQHGRQHAHPGPLLGGQPRARVDRGRDATGAS